MLKYMWGGIMEILQLRYFCDASETQNFSQTAKKFMVPPSTVSQTIRRLEKELGVTLFERKSNKISLNDDGRIFYNAVKQSKNLIKQARNIIEDKEGLIHGEISILVLCNRRIVTEAVKLFNQKYPQVAFEITHQFSTEKEFDIIISDRDLWGGKLNKKEIINEDIAIAIPKFHPLYGEKDINISKLANDKFITMHSDGSLYNLTVEICENAGFKPNISIQCDDPYYMRKYVEMGLGIAFYPVFSWKNLFSDKTASIKLKGITRKTYIFHDSSRYVTKAVKTFKEILFNLCK